MTGWTPSRFLRYERTLGSSMRTAEIVTDAGKAYGKFMGNPRGPHLLACDLVGTELAAWLGLPALDWALLRIQPDDEIPLGDGRRAEPGPALVTRAVSASQWDGSEESLREIVNPAVIARTVVFDTWTLNCDRHSVKDGRTRENTDNVLLVFEGDQQRPLLFPMDHTDCFSCGRELGPWLQQIDVIRDERIFGLFDAFKARVTRTGVEAATMRLREFTPEVAQATVGRIPAEWAVSPSAAEALVELLVQRAAFVADTIVETLTPLCWPQGSLLDGSEV